MTTPALRQVTPGVHVAEANQRFFGVEVGARMTVLELNGGILVHSPINLDPGVVSHLGPPRWVLAPNKLHHLYVGPWAQAGFEPWAAPGLPKKRPDLTFQGVIEQESQPFGDDLHVMPLACFSFTNEVVVLHRPSKTLIVSDLVFNFPKTAPLLTRVAMRCLCGYPGCRASLLERVGMRRNIARREIGAIASWDFDRVVMAHGDVIETGGKKAFLDAYRWLKLGKTA